MVAFQSFLAGLASVMQQDWSSTPFPVDSFFKLELTSFELDPVMYSTENAIRDRLSEFLDPAVNGYASTFRDLKANPLKGTLKFTMDVHGSGPQDNPQEGPAPEPLADVEEMGPAAWEMEQHRTVLASDFATVKLRIYHTLTENSEKRFTVEFQRRNGDSILFNHFFHDLGSYLKGDYSQETSKVRDLESSLEAPSVPQSFLGFQDSPILAF